MMETFPIVTLVWVILMALGPLLSIPTFRKVGWSSWWCLLWYLPFVNVIFLWIFAFAKWPNEPGIVDVVDVFD